jgi:hypothetical protein
VPTTEGVEKRSDDAMTAYLLAECGRIAKEREDIGFGQQVAESIQHFFATAPIQ